MRVLFLTQDLRFGSLVEAGFKRNKSHLQVVSSPAKMIEAMKAGSFTVIVIELPIGHSEPQDLIGHIHELRPKTPIIVVVNPEMGAIDERVLKNLGVQEILYRPLKFREILANARLLARRSGLTAPDNLITVGELILDLETRMAERKGEPIRLTTKEFELLEYLIKKRGQVVSRNKIANDVWDIHFDTGTNFVDVYITYLRKKIDRPYQSNYIKTVVGEGYTIGAEA